MNDEGEPEAALLRSLESDDRNERSTALLQLAELGDTHLPRAEAFLDDPDDRVVAAASIACWRLGRRDLPFKRLFAALSSIEEDVAMMAASALSSLGDDVIPKLEEGVAAGGRDAKRILHVLADIGSSAARAVVENGARSKDAAISTEAKSVLREWDE